VDLVFDLFSVGLRGSEPVRGHYHEVAWQPDKWTQSTLENIVKISSMLHVLPAMREGVLKILERCGASDKSDELSELHEFLSDITANNKARNLEILSIMEQVTSVLENAGITPVWLKGASHLIDGDEHILGSRFLSVVDLLVKEEELAASVKALNQAGYLRIDEYPGKTPIEFDTEVMRHYPRLVHEGHIVGLEVHTRIFETNNNPFARHIDIMTTNVSVSRGGRSWLLPSVGNRLFHLIYHSIISNRRYEWQLISLRDQLDFYNLCSNGLDCQLVHKMAETFADQGYGLHFAAFCELARQTQSKHTISVSGLEGIKNEEDWADMARGRLANPKKMRLTELSRWVSYYYQNWKSGTPIFSGKTLVYARTAIDRIRKTIGEFK
jgi:hypothetical protein